MAETSQERGELADFLRAEAESIGAEYTARPITEAAQHEIAKFRQAADLLSQGEGQGDVERILGLLRDPEQLEFLWQEVRRRTRVKTTREEVRASVEAALEPSWERAALDRRSKLSATDDGASGKQNSQGERSEL